MICDLCEINLDSKRKGFESVSEKLVFNQGIVRTGKYHLQES